MSIFRTAFTYFVTLLYILFLGYTVHATSTLGDGYAFVLHESLFAPCTTSVVCEETDTGYYTCRDIPEVLQSASSCTQSLNIGKNTTDTVYPVTRLGKSGNQYKYSGKLQYAQVEHYHYPFTRITKIQV